MTKKQKISELKAKIDTITQEHQAEYTILADRSEKLYDRQEALKKDYKVLDEKTGLNALFEELTELVERK
ncbi:hypothetical protein AKG98_4011 [Moritella sp. JT01]|uniref:hypothetical protein n=1 Tax=Moritella sp. JT01 TaxID=756698 RepID=UPI0007957846|nr:hypothetical protein [Moritella sp. JT01]KXO12815.1 hypothetical protein AKG98_4011 [Moritella sp. JT01]